MHNLWKNLLGCGLIVDVTKEKICSQDMPKMLKNYHCTVISVRNHVFFAYHCINST